MINLHKATTEEIEEELLENEKLNPYRLKKMIRELWYRKWNERIDFLVITEAIEKEKGLWDVTFERNKK